MQVVSWLAPTSTSSAKAARMSLPFPEPTAFATSRSELFLTYLDYFRSVLLTKVDGLTDEQMRQTVLPSAWTPIELVKHLACVEMRWLVWGFEGQDVGDPWLDQRDGRWYVAPDETADSVAQELLAQGETTRAVVRSHQLSDHGEPGERWDGAAPPRGCSFTYCRSARHVGHMDIVRESLDGDAGE